MVKIEKIQNFLVDVTPVVRVVDFSSSTNGAKLGESILRLIEPTERPARRSAVLVEIDAVALPFDVVALSLLPGDLDLNVVELEFVLDSSDEAERVVESAPVSGEGDVVIDSDSHKNSPLKVNLRPTACRCDRQSCEP